jgi:tetratricopeptide (TPR) repeat protein
LRDLLHLSSAGPREYDVELPDTLFALCDLLSEVTPIPGSLEVEEIVATYDMVAALEWPQDELRERVELLTRLSYLAWSRCRRSATYPQVRLWRDRCVGHVFSQEVVRDFLAVRFSERSERLNERFLVDPAIVLAACVKFENDRNVRPSLVARDAVLAYQWVSDRSAEWICCDDALFFGGDLALSASVALRHIGRASSSKHWLGTARNDFSRTSNAEAELARVRVQELSLLQERHESEEVVRLLPPVIETLAKHGVLRELCYARLLEAVALKDGGGSEQAGEKLTQLVTDESVRTDPLAYGIALVTLAQYRAATGRFDESLELLRQAAPVVDQAGAPIVTGQFYASLGEGFRDRGFLEQAETAYRTAISTFIQAEMCRWVAYLQVILAEVLLAGGREREAIAELLSALPVIARESLGREGAVAIALLSKSIRRQNIDANALSGLRERLQTIRNGYEE